MSDAATSEMSAGRRYAEESRGERGAAALDKAALSDRRRPRQAFALSPNASAIVTFTAEDGGDETIVEKLSLQLGPAAGGCGLPVTPEDRAWLADRLRPAQAGDAPSPRIQRGANPYREFSRRSKRRPWTNNVVGDRSSTSARVKPGTGEPRRIASFFWGSSR